MEDMRASVWWFGVGLEKVQGRTDELTEVMASWRFGLGVLLADEPKRRFMFVEKRGAASAIIVTDDHQHPRCPSLLVVVRRRTRIRPFIKYPLKFSEKYLALR